MSFTSGACGAIHYHRHSFAVIRNSVFIYWCNSLKSSFIIVMCVKLFASNSPIKHAAPRNASFCRLVVAHRWGCSTWWNRVVMVLLQWYNNTKCRMSPSHIGPPDSYMRGLVCNIIWATRSKLSHIFCFLTYGCLLLLLIADDQLSHHHYTLPLALSLALSLLFSISLNSLLSGWDMYWSISRVCHVVLLGSH